MIKIEEVIISKLIYHKFNLDINQVMYNQNLFEYDTDDDLEVLKKIFLKPFVNCYATYEFSNNINIDLNTLFNISQNIFEGNNFVENTIKIYKHLFNVSKHPNIKDGDLFITKFEDVEYNNKFYEALGIYKIENKEEFIETNIYSKNETGISFKKGISNKKLDKACLILFGDKPYTIFVIDNAKTETDYWHNEFLSIILKNDNVNSTNHFLNIAKNFVTKQLTEEFEVSKADQIDLLNKSVEYFKTHEIFEKKEFEEIVFQDKGIIKSFRNFDEQYRETNDVEIADSFDVSAPALKKQAKIFKSVLKLDKNFHIYIHGDREMIEQGIDKDGRKFYKIYYQDER